VEAEFSDMVAALPELSGKRFHSWMAESSLPTAMWHTSYEICDAVMLEASELSR
jgi:hypothetical protein